MRNYFFKPIAWFFLIIVFSGCFQLSARRIAELDDYFKVPFVLVDRDQVYIWDQNFQKIIIYSRHGYKKIKEFGRHGEGPGEFIGINIVTIDDDYIYVSNYPKLSIFSRAGKLEEEIKGPNNVGIFIPCGGNFVGKIELPYPRRGIKFKNLFALFDSDLEKITDLKETESNKYVIYGENKEIINLIRSTISARVFDEKIFIGEPDRGFIFYVFDKKGRMLYEIKRETGVRPVTDAEKQEEINILKKLLGKEEWNRRKMMVDYYFPDVYPAFEDFFVSNNRIYVFDFLRGEKRDIEILDLKGNLLGKVTIDEIPYRGCVNFRRYYIHDGKLYYPYENQDEEQWELHEIDLDGLLNHTPLNGEGKSPK